MTYGTFGAMPHEQVRLRDGTNVARDVYDQTVPGIDKFYKTDYLSFCALVDQCRYPLDHQGEETSKRLIALIDKKVLPELKGDVVLQIQSIVLNSVKGEGWEIKLVHPCKRSRFACCEGCTIA